MFFKKKPPRYIVERSNVIQYDTMGYPLRLVIFNDGKQEWIDTIEKPEDMLLLWSKIDKGEGHEV